MDDFEDALAVSGKHASLIDNTNLFAQMEARSGDISVLPEVNRLLDYEGRSLAKDLIAPELNSIRDRAAVPD